MGGVLGGLGISPTSRAKNGVGIFRVSGERAHGRPACPVEKMKITIQYNGYVWYVPED